MQKISFFNTNANTSNLSVIELKELEQTLSKEISKVRNGIIDDDFAGYEQEELLELLLEQRLAVQNHITAKSIRGSH